MFLVAGAGILLHRRLSARRAIQWATVITVLLSLLLASYNIGKFTSYGDLSIIFTFFVGLKAILVAIGISAWLIITRPNWQKLMAIGFMLLSIASIIGGYRIGDYHTPENIMQRNAETIVKALERYHDQFNHYPATIDGLVPEQLPQLPEAITTQGTGWLYTSDGTSYTLGYWMLPYKFGVHLCLYGSENRLIQDCGLTERDGWEPFSPIYTPMPDNT